MQNETAKFQLAEESITELRQQLHETNIELTRFRENMKKYEAQNTDFREQRNTAVDEVNSLMKIVERNSLESERMKLELQTAQQQLKVAINGKCDALAKLDEIQGKELKIDFREKRMEQERTMLLNQIQCLNEDLSRNINEIQSLRRSTSMKSLTIETKLNEKCEELKIANQTIQQLNESNIELTAKTEYLTQKLEEDSEESLKMMSYYKKELQLQTKLAELHKESDEDNSRQIEELGNAVNELKRCLQESSEDYGTLETKLKSTCVKYEDNIAELNINIVSLKSELSNANVLLKDANSENLDNAVSHFSPAASTSRSLIKSGFTLTELYTQYVREKEELLRVKKENAKLDLQLQNILHEVEEKAPLFRQMNLDRQNAVQAYQELETQVSELIQSRAALHSEVDDIRTKSEYIDRENKKLRIERSDLSRQVCYLLNVIEQNRCGIAGGTNQSVSSDMSANEVITKKLITFNDIQDLQENNMRLTYLVRDLSGKLEEIEVEKNTVNQQQYEAKVQKYTKQIQDMQVTLKQQMNMMNSFMQQRDRYKKLYYEIRGGNDKSSLNRSFSNSREDNMDNMVIDDENPCTPSHSSENSSNKQEINPVTQELQDQIKALEEKLISLGEEHAALSNEYDVYQKEMQTNEKMANEQLDQMRAEIRDISSSNTNLLSTLQCKNDQIKIQQSNATTYKKQIATLEQRNKNCEHTIMKHESSIIYMKDETMSCHNKLTRAEVLIENLKQELQMTKDAETRLMAEREMLIRERQSQSLLLNKIEMIKVSIERSEAEGKQRMDDRLDETIRECSALRRRLQEEQDRFRELQQHLDRQKDTIQTRLDEELVVSKQLKADLEEARNDLDGKTSKIDELNIKIQEILTPSKNSNPIAEANKRVREMEMKYNESIVEIESLQKELESAKEHSKQYCNMSSEYENELKELDEAYSNYKTSMEAELAETKKNGVNLQNRINEMETEISLRETTAQLNSGDVNTELVKIQTELKDALTKLCAHNRELSEYRERCTNIENSLRITEKKYANEMSQRSNDIQALTNLKDELFKFQSKYEELQSQRDNAQSALEVNKEKWVNMEKKLLAERDEFEQRIKDLNSQNEVLHEQIQTLSSISKSLNTDGNLDGSMEVGNSSLLNKSLNENEPSEKLLQIIRYLRKEKDIAFAKVDILRAENVRMQSEMSILAKKLAETNDELKSERMKSEMGSVTANKHNEILRKVETLNAITDSNRILREERDELTTKVKDLSERLSKFEDEFYPLQDKNREFQGKIDSITAENAALRVEATRWRQRANLLVERSNKTNPEDWKRLQNERENLVKMLTTEKDNLKKATDELTTVRTEKLHVEGENIINQKKLENLTDEIKKLSEEVASLRQENGNKNLEIESVKSTITSRDNDIKKLSAELTDKETKLIELRNREERLRKIAKRYKDTYYELKTNVSDKDKPESGSEQSSSDPKATKSEKEKIMELQIIELKIELTTYQNELETYRRKELDELDPEVLIDANKKVNDELLQKIKNQNVELALKRTQMNVLRSESETLKNQFEGKIARLEKEMADMDSESKETIARLNRENESLVLRVNQLHRQMGLQQVTKPSTSTGSSDKPIADAPPTANVKPMAGSSSPHQSPTARRGSETPLASIRPMSVQGSRTAAVHPTTQASNVASVQGTSSTSTSSSISGSITALVPPQQQVHTTAGSNNSGEAMSSSPTSSHTDYMPATSSATVVVATVTPMGSASNVAESSQQENEISNQTNESISSQIVLPGGSQQQMVVALIVPRVESSPQNIQQQQADQQQQLLQQQEIQAHQAPQQIQTVERSQAPSTSGTTSSSSNQQAIALVSHHQASSSSTVTTTQAAHKNKRDSDNETDSKSDTQTQQIKRRRVDAFQGVSESGLDVEYQVPTSSQRDQEDDIIVVDSDDEDEDDDDDDGMVDEDNADADDGPYEVVIDNGDGYEMEESYEQEQEIVNFDDGEGPDIDEDNVQSANNEVDFDDDIEVPNQSETSSNSNINQVGPDAGTSSNQIDQSGSALSSSNTIEQNDLESSTTQHSSEIQQIQSISSGSDATSALQTPSPHAYWRQGTPQSSRQALTIQHNYDEGADDRKVPCTPTLYASRRLDR